MGEVSTIGLVSVQTFLQSILDDLEMPYGRPNAEAFIIPPDPRTESKIPGIYIWPSDGDESRAPDVGGTIPRNTGVGTAAALKGILHRMDVYLVYFSAESGRKQDPVFSGMVDAVMFALRYSTPNPVPFQDPNTGLFSTIYNIGEKMTYRTGVASTASQRTKKFDALITLEVWEVFNA